MHNKNSGSNQPSADFYTVSLSHTVVTYIFTYGSEKPLESMAASPAQRLMPIVSRSMLVS